MTIKLEFDKSFLNKLIQHLDWLKGLGVVKSYEVENKHTTITENPSDGEELIEDMMQKADEAIADGNLLTTEEVTKRTENWLKKHK